jgi:hypothetical protein
MGIKDLEFFPHALFLKWLWHKWTEKDGDWTWMEVPCDKTDMELFYTSTVVTNWKETRPPSRNAIE